MGKIPFVLLFAAAVATGVATLVEDFCGTETAFSLIYDAAWFRLLWTALIATAAVLAVRQRMWKQRAVFLLHLSFAVIFIGASVTALTGRKGRIHLRQDMPESRFTTDDRQVCALPFSMTLDSFRVEYYAGTRAPADYVSHITVRNADGAVQESPVISMNRIYAAGGYRFYQTSYDGDGRGSLLSVNYDPWGTAIVYSGFLLLCISFIFVLLARDGGFRRLLRHPLIRGGGLLAAVWSAAPLQTRAALPVVNRAQADSMAVRQVVYNERIAPFNTLARDFVQKIYGRPDFRGLTPEQVVCSWMLYPDEWNRVPVIRIKSRALRRRLGLEDDCASLSDLFDGSRYRLQALWEQEKDRQSPLAKAIRETDEKAGLVLMLRQGTLISPLPPDAPRLSRQKIQAEILYNRIPFSKILFITLLTAGIAAGALQLVRMLKSRRAPRLESHLWSVLLCTAALFHTAGYGLRWYVSGNIPLGNGFETLQFAAAAVLWLTVALHRRFSSILPCGLLLSGFALLTAYMGEMNPRITPLVPVLSSPWLSWHVSSIMIAYALFALMFLNGIFALLPVMRRNSARRQAAQLTLLSRLMLYPAECLLGIGIVLGAVWANVSWGSYWSWDPKEAWALIAFIVYSVPFHHTGLRWLSSPRRFHLYMIAAFGVVLMTYFGVNYLLGGMHSYANS